MSGRNVTCQPVRSVLTVVSVQERYAWLSLADVMSFTFDVPDTGAHGSPTMPNHEGHSHKVRRLSPCNNRADQVYVSGLPESTTEEDLATHFGSIGVLKEDKKRSKPKIWLYRDKSTGALKVCWTA